MSFNQKDKLAALDQALRSPLPEVILKAAHVIVDGINRVKAGENFGQGRDQRDPITTSSLASYQRFIPALQALQKNPETDISNAASTVLAQIQSLNIAQNP